MVDAVMFMFFYRYLLARHRCEQQQQQQQQVGEKNEGGALAEAHKSTACLVLVVQVGSLQTHQFGQQIGDLRCHDVCGRKQRLKPNNAS